MVKGSASKPGRRIGMVKLNYAEAICSSFDLIQGSPWVWDDLCVSPNNPLATYKFDEECMYNDGNIPRDKNLQAHYETI